MPDKENKYNIELELRADSKELPYWILSSNIVFTIILDFSLDKLSIILFLNILQFIFNLSTCVYEFW